MNQNQFTESTVQIINSMSKEAGDRKFNQRISNGLVVENDRPVDRGEVKESQGEKYPRHSSYYGALMEYS